MAGSWGGSAMRPESLIALAERLKTDARRVRKEGRESSAADLRYAAFACRRYAALVVVANELMGERDPVRRRRLTEEVGSLWAGARHG
jgi:hypothetical protein